MRYLKQPKWSYFCAPIAFMNVLKWAGCNVTYKKHLKLAKKHVYYMNRKGACDGGFSLALDSSRVILKFYIRRCITMGLIDKHLDSGGIVALTTTILEDGIKHKHLWTISEKNGKSYTAHNITNIYGKYCSTIVFPRAEIVHRLRKSSRSIGNPKGWFISERKVSG